MKEKILINGSSLEEVKLLYKKGFVNIYLPLKDYCVGYEEFSVNDIMSLDFKSYVLINRILTFKEIDVLKKIIIKLEDKVRGIIFEDIGVFELLKEINFSKDMIYFPNHFATNWQSINTFLESGLTSVVISNEITKEEVDKILFKVSKEVIVPIYGYNQIMYSRRTLISNFNDYYKLNLSKDNKITEKMSKKELRIKENDFGTVIFDEVYKNTSLIDKKKNVKYFLVNTTYLEIEKVLEDLKQRVDNNKGFLNKKTIYKMGDIRDGS